MASITEVANRFRSNLARDRKATNARLMAAYGDALTRLRADNAALARRIADARRTGETVDAAWLARQASAQVLEVELRARMTAAARTAANAIPELTRRAVERSADDSGKLLTVLAAAGPGDGLNAGAFEHIVGVTERGPLRALLEERAGASVDDVVKVLRQGVAEGWDPAKTAREMERVAGGPLTNALTIARTEQLRAYRETARLSYAAAGIAEWEWFCRCTRRSCAFCWSQHGQVFATSKPMPTHPNCVCMMLPVVGGPRLTPGADKFAALDPIDQVTILGPAAHAAWRDGALELPDLAGFGRSREWGPVGGRRSLVDVLGPEAAARYYTAARS